MTLSFNRPEDQIKDLEGSWRDGNLFCRLVNITIHQADRITLQGKTPLQLLETAFRKAQEKLDVPQILQAQGRYEFIKSQYYLSVDVSVAVSVPG